MNKRYIDENAARDLFDEHLDEIHKCRFKAHLLRPFDAMSPSEILKCVDCHTYESLLEDWLDERELHYQVKDTRHIDW